MKCSTKKEGEAEIMRQLKMAAAVYIEVNGNSVYVCAPKTIIDMVDNKYQRPEKMFHVRDTGRGAKETDDE